MAQEPTEGLQTGQHRILVCDANVVAGRLIKYPLERVGHNVALVHNFVDAVEVLSQVQNENLPGFDCALIDQSMLGSEGSDVLDWIHAHDLVSKMWVCVLLDPAKPEPFSDRADFWVPNYADPIRIVQEEYELRTMAEPIPSFNESMSLNFDRYLAPILWKPFVSELRGGGGDFLKILEVACGTGYRLRWAVPDWDEDCTYTVTDASQSLLNHARRSLANPSKRASWRVADPKKLRFDDSKFDEVVCSFDFATLSDKPDVIREAHRVLVPGGVFSFGLWADVSKNPIFGAVMTALESEFPDHSPPYIPSLYSMSDPTVIQNLMVEIGFTDVDVSTETFPIEGYPASVLAHAFVYGTPITDFLFEHGRPHTRMYTTLRDVIRAQLGDPIRTEATALICTGWTEK